ncbi:MAG: CHAT domain-containing protein, partial [Actinomycetota bacterium]
KAVLTDEVERLKVEQSEARSELQKFQDALYARRPQLRAQRAGFTPATVDELAANLFARAPKSALLSYFVLADQTLLFVLRSAPDASAKLTMQRLPVGGLALVRRGEALWQACSTPGGAFEAPAKALYRDLIQPALPNLKGVNHLIIAPSSDLGVLPFAALLDESSAPLIAKYSVSYAPSATALMHQAELSPTRTSPAEGLPLLAFGNPIFPPNLGELPATEGEVVEISRLFGPKARSFIRKEALESRAKTLLTQARVVHFATHGTLDERAPMYSSVVLTRDDREDGFLQARELSEMELNADMVVLSACETALGEKVRGEGVVGLSWALFVGGAESTVTSQWQVPDDSTRTLMIQFYRRLLRDGADRAEAIRQAQLTLFRDKRYAHPYHWAPFTLSGQWLPASATPARKHGPERFRRRRTLTGDAVNRKP